MRLRGERSRPERSRALQNGKTLPLHEAAANGHAEKVEELLKALPCDPEAKDQVRGGGNRGFFGGGG